MITGLDLVKLQIEIAGGKVLSLAQEDIRQRGHAIEARLYAEDPSNGFLPATGMLHEWDAPSSIAGLRIDAGVERGTEVGIHYDPMLAKLIAHGSDRETARHKLAYGLRSLFAPGLQTNREFLIRALEHPDFEGGSYNTGFVDELLDELIASDNEADGRIAAGVVALYLGYRQQAEASILPSIPRGYRNNPFRDPS
jgi:acetyl/propionyl-CoA carboxylase alpha subunit